MSKRNIILLCAACVLILALGIVLVCCGSCSDKKTDPGRSDPSSTEPQAPKSDPVNTEHPVSTDANEGTGEEPTIPPVTDAPATDDPKNPVTTEAPDEQEPTEDPFEIEIPIPTPTPTPRPGETAAPTDVPTSTPEPVEEPASTPDNEPIELPELP